MAKPTLPKNSNIVKSQAIGSGHLSGLDGLTFKEGTPPCESFIDVIEKEYPHATSRGGMKPEEWRKFHPDVDYRLGDRHSMEAHGFLYLAGRYMELFGGLLCGLNPPMSFITMEEVDAAAKRVEQAAIDAMAKSEIINGKLGYCDAETRNAVVAHKLEKSQDDRRKERGIPTPPGFQAKHAPKKVEAITPQEPETEMPQELTKSPLYDRVMQYLQWYQFPNVCTCTANNAVITTMGKSWQAKRSDGAYSLTGIGTDARWCDVGSAEDLTYYLRRVTAWRKAAMNNHHEEPRPTRRVMRSVGGEVNAELYRRFELGKGKQPKQYARLPHKFLLDRFGMELRLSYDNLKPKKVIGHVDTDGTWRLNPGWRDIAPRMAVELKLRVPAEECEEVPY